MRRGLTRTQLANAIGVTPATIRAYEEGQHQRHPYRHHLYRLAEALKYPTDFFLAKDLEIINQEAASFRALSTMRASLRDAALALGSLALALDGYLRELVALPVVNVPDLSDHDPETAAIMTRQYWGLGDKPIPNVVHLLESKGIRVFFLHEDAREVDAFSLWRGGIPLCFLNTYKTAEHSRFDAAHELGHLILHRGYTGHKEMEKEANAFAAAFLMPETGIITEAPKIYSLRQLLPLKARWRVSLAAMVRRLYQLRMMSKWQYEGLCIEMSRKGFLKSEPEPRIKREQSLVFTKVFTLLWQQGITREMIANRTGLPLDELSALTSSAAEPSAAEPTPRSTGLRLV